MVATFLPASASEVGGQRLASVFAAPASEAAPIPGVGALGVGRPLLSGVYIPGARFGVVIDVAGGTDGLRVDKFWEHWYKTAINSYGSHPARLARNASKGSFKLPSISKSYQG
jgi:hypothetical protein